MLHNDKITCTGDVTIMSRNIDRKILSYNPNRKVTKTLYRNVHLYSSSMIYYAHMATMLFNLVSTM